MSQSKIWYVVVDGKPQGPHTQAEIQEKLALEKINYSDLVFRPGLSRWMAVGECQEFERRKESSDDKHGHTAGKLTVPSGEDSPDDHWVILVKLMDSDGKHHYVQSGPYSADVVKKKLKQGELKYTDHIWKKGQKSWAVINTLDFFERRTEASAPASAPAPELATQTTDPTQSFDEAATVVRPSYDDDAKTKVAIKFEEKSKANLLPEDPFETDDELPVKKFMGGSLSKIKFSFDRRHMLMAGGLTLAIAITYAGLNVYTETNQTKVEPRKVASQKAPPPPAPVVVPPAPVSVPVNSQTDPTNTSKAVNPELENRLPKKPSVLKVISLKTNSDRPQVVLETDLPGGTSIDVQVTARSGSILKYPSFEMTKKVVVTDGQLPTVDFTQDKLPPGDYRVFIKGGNLETNLPFSIGEHNADFQKRLAVFKAKVAVQRKKEKAGLEDGLKFVSRSYASLTAEYRKSRTTPGAAAKKKWLIMLRSWRKDFERQVGMLKNVEEKNRNYFVFPEALLKLKEVESQLSDVTELYDKSLKTGRSIASETDMNEAFLEHVNDLRENVRKIK